MARRSSLPDMEKDSVLRPAEPDRDFAKLAEWFSILEDEPNSETGLRDYHEKNRERIFHRVAQDTQVELLGFYWAVRHKFLPGRLYFYLYVKPEARGQGLGSRLYQHLFSAVGDLQIEKLQVSLWDNCSECLAFAKNRGFTESLHRFAMALDLDTFDDSPYDEIISRLKSEGFQFTSMEALGNTEDAQRKLYLLNDTAVLETPGTEGEHSWDSFEDFQKNVCQADWYKPGGQMVVIDTFTGAWVAMSAITRWEGADYAYNLFTGVDRRYRGRKLGPAVKVLALRYARDVLNVNLVRTHHNAQNLPMIAIDRKFGYFQLPGTFLMEKNLT